MPGGSYANKKALERFIQSNQDDIIFYDAQTSGGLLLALDSANARELVKKLQDKGMDAKIIASCVSKREYDIFVQ